MWRNNTKNKHSEDLGFRYARYIFIGILVIVFTIIIWFGGNEKRITEPRTLVIYCYSGMQVVMEKAIFPIFREHWFEQTGEKVEFISTFAGSGEITKKVMKKFPAEIAILSSKLDAWRLSTYGIADNRPFLDLPHLGIVARTPLVLFIDEENLKNINNYPDLINTNAKLILPNPSTSGAGELAILSIYGSELKKNISENEALQTLKNIWKKIDVFPSCAIEALEVYNQGMGNILFGYEANLLANPKQDSASGYIIYPRSTILCEPVATRIARNIDPKQKELVEAFIQFMWSNEAQIALVEYGFQSVDKWRNMNRSDFGYIQEPITIDSLGSYLNMKRIINSIVLEPS